MESVGIPALTDHNGWADFWYYEIGVNVIPAHTQKKKTFVEWKRWQIESIPEELHAQWKHENVFKDGMAIVLGKVWRGEHIGEYLTFIDLDNSKAIEDFCAYFPVDDDGNGCAMLKDIAEKYFIIEQHLDDTSKAHIFFYSETHFTKKSSDVNIIDDANKFKNDEIPAFEIKGLGTHGIAYCTPSVHKNGHRYQILGTTSPVKLTDDQAKRMMEYINTVCKNYDLHYLEYDNGNGKSLTPIPDLFRDEYVIVAGNNRHEALLRVMDSLIRRNYGVLDPDEIKEIAYKWNQKHCQPPLDDKEFEKQWKGSAKFIVPRIAIESEGGNEEEHQQPVSSSRIREDIDDIEDEEEDNKKTAKAKKALELVIANSQELFVNEFGRAFAAIRVNNHVEVHPMDEQRFKNWISGIYYEQNDDLLSEDDLKKIVRILTAKAEFPSNHVSKHRLDVRVRGYNKKQEELFSQNGDGDNDVSSVGYVGSNGEITEDFDTIYYDLTNKRWEAVKITLEGWEVDKHTPILFRRYGSERPQPYPDRNYEPDVFDKFLDLLNLKQEHKEMQKQLLKPQIITMFWPNTTPKPILILPAAQGSAKTTACELIRDLVDPNTTLTTSLPKEDFNLKQSLAHNYVSFFDNVSDIKDWQSDVLCRAVTGAGDMKRKLYENDEDIIYSYRRIAGLNGITNAVTKADLLDRGMLIELGEIARKDRKLLRIIWRKYLELKPKLLAFCFDVIAEVMKERKKWKGIDEDFFGMEDVIIQKGGLPRMADWAILAEQVSAIIARTENKPYTAGQFLEAFDKNLDILNIEALKSSLVAEALIAFMTEREVMKRGVDTVKYRNPYPHWEGSPTMLLADLNQFIEETPSVKINTKSRAWPQDPAVIGKEIARIAPNLRALGIIIETKRTNKNILYTISKLPTQPTLPTLSGNSRSDEGSKECREPCKDPTQNPTPKGSENHAQNGASAGSVGSVGKMPNPERDESSKATASCSTTIPQGLAEREKKTPDGILALVEGYRMEIYEKAIKEGKDLVSPSEVNYEDLYRLLLVTGDFTPLTAATAIHDLEEREKEEKEGKE
jgi:hypothetical protein